MDLNSLEPPTIKDITPESLLQEMVAQYEKTGGLSLPKDSPESFLLAAFAYMMSLREEEHNRTAKQNLLAFAEGPYLDHLGALMDVSRLEASSAKTTFEFTLDTNRGTTLTIPQGTRVRSNDSKDFRC